MEAIANPAARATADSGRRRRPARVHIEAIESSGDRSPRAASREPPAIAIAIATATATATGRRTAGKFGASL
ncbi:hypothetical protein [Burkholderia savannae]|uniref:hypothetical protein n=1 Tax=Burkholderia savannae TaxID=1637837 RepID=UPI000A3E1CB6|nr:hypothetical protein [Burkholderia savannae]